MVAPLITPNLSHSKPATKIIKKGGESDEVYIEGLQEAANHGNAYAQINLGTAYEIGEGVS